MNENTTKKRPSSQEFNKQQANFARNHVSLCVGESNEEGGRRRPVPPSRSVASVQVEDETRQLSSSFPSSLRSNSPLPPSRLPPQPPPTTSTENTSRKNEFVNRKPPHPNLPTNLRKSDSSLRFFSQRKGEDHSFTEGDVPVRAPILPTLTPQMHQLHLQELQQLQQQQQPLRTKQSDPQLPTSHKSPPKRVKSPRPNQLSAGLGSSLSLDRPERPERPERPDRLDRATSQKGSAIHLSNSGTSSPITSHTLNQSSNQSSFSQIYFPSVANSQFDEITKMKIENLLIECSRLQFNAMLTQDHLSALEQERNALIEEKEKLQQRRATLQRQIQKLENQLSQEITFSSAFSQLRDVVQSCSLLMKITVDDALKTHTEIPVSSFRSIIRQLEEFLICNEIDRLQNVELQMQLDSLKEQNKVLEKQIASLEDLFQRRQNTNFYPKVHQIEQSLSEFQTFITSSSFQPSNPAINDHLTEMKRVTDECIACLKQVMGKDLISDNKQLFSTSLATSLPDQVENLRSGTVNDLVERLTYPTYPDMGFQKAFLLTYRSFISPLELLGKLILRYCITPEEDLPDAPLQEIRRSTQVPVQLRVTNVLKAWLDNHFVDFDKNMNNYFSAFINSIVKMTNQKLAVNINSTLEKKLTGTFRMKIVSSSKSPPESILPVGFLQGTNSWKFDDIHPIEYARQITLLEHRLYKAIEPSELLNQSWNKRDKAIKSPNVLAMIKTFNTISNWATFEVVNTPDLQQRVIKLSKFIRIAKECHRINNFNATMEMVAALENASVHRLKKTWEKLSKEDIEVFEDLKTLPDSNYKKFRDQLHLATPPCVPYVGIFLTDLTFIEDGNPDRIDGLINFGKLRQVAEKIQEVQQYQNDTYVFKEIKEIQTYLDNLKEESSETIYNLSLKVEPKQRQ